MPTPLLFTLPQGMTMCPSGPLPAIAVFEVPPAPSTSCLTPNRIVASVCLVRLTNVLFGASFKLLLVVLLNFPFAYALGLLLPFAYVLSSPSAIAGKALHGVSGVLLSLRSKSSSVLCSVLSASAFAENFYTAASAPFDSLLTSTRDVIPGSAALISSFGMGSFAANTLPVRRVLVAWSPTNAFDFS